MARYGRFFAAADFCDFWRKQMVLQQHVRTRTALYSFGLLSKAFSEQNDTASDFFKMVPIRIPCFFLDDVLLNGLSDLSRRERSR